MITASFRSIRAALIGILPLYFITRPVGADQGSVNASHDLPVGYRH